MNTSADVRVMYRRLLYAAVVTALASTAAVWTYYRAAHAGAFAGLDGLLVWFAATLLIPLGFAWAGYWLAMLLFDNRRRAFLWALALMVAVALIMFFAEWMVTWPDRPIPRPSSMQRPTSLNVGAWDGRRLVGSIRVLTDGYFFATIPEILVDPAYQRRGIGRRLMELALARAPRGKVAFSAQPQSVEFFDRIGCRRALTGFVAELPRADANNSGEKA